MSTSSPDSILETWISTASRIASSPPILSVCMPVCNGSKFLERAFACLAAQTFKQFEIVMVDDGSRDASANEACALIEHHRLRGTVVRTDNHGCEQARDIACSIAADVSRDNNRGKRSASKVLAAFDCDDYWEPTYLAEMYSALQSDPSIGLVYCDFVEEFTATGHAELKSKATPWIDLAQATQQGDLYKFPRGLFFPMLLQGQVLFPPCTMYRRDLYERAGRYVDQLSKQRVSLDWSFGLRASRAGVVAFLHRPLLRKYVHGANVSGDPLQTASCDVAVLDVILQDVTLTQEERQHARNRACACAFGAAYASWLRSMPRDARRWCRRSLSYGWNPRAVKLILSSLVPIFIINALRGSRHAAPVNQTQTIDANE